MGQTKKDKMVQMITNCTKKKQRINSLNVSSLNILNKRQTVGLNKKELYAFSKNPV